MIELADKTTDRSIHYDTGQVDAKGRRLIKSVFTATPVRFKNDADAWEDVAYEVKDKLPGNCEMKIVDGGYRLWKPNGKPPYNQEWLDTDYWVEITSQTSAYKVLRVTILETFTGDVDAKDACSDNLTRTVAPNGLVLWHNANGDLIFSRIPGAMTMLDTGELVAPWRAELRFA